MVFVKNPRAFEDGWQLLTFYHINSSVHVCRTREKENQSSLTSLYLSSSRDHIQIGNASTNLELKYSLSKASGAKGQFYAILSKQKITHGSFHIPYFKVFSYTRVVKFSKKSALKTSALKQYSSSIRRRHKLEGNMRIMWRLAGQT